MNNNNESDEPNVTFTYSASFGNSAENFQSSLAKAASNQPQSKQGIEKLDKALSKLKTDLAKVDAVNPTPTNRNNRYKAAWDHLYKNSQQWRKTEIDNSLKSGTFGNEHWDTAFVKQVIELAESNTPLP